MIRAMDIAQTILLASTTIVFAQGGNRPSERQGAPPPRVLGQTGTMYDGNNADLQLPADPNSYWTALWAVPIAGSASPSSTAESVSGRQGGGQQ
jgi:hypothetical protein